VIGRPVDELRSVGVCGTPDEVVKKLRAYGDVGAETIYLQVLDLHDLDHLDLLAAEVMPHV
jgi:alkanesulfonate monooxygenase SsuD/methylene tetrahydromethanopterin reductase-like flavin-dependent oxidoreductase (luciferase family)